MSSGASHSGGSFAAAYWRQIVELAENDDLEGLLAAVSLDDLADAWWRYTLRLDAAHEAEAPEAHTDPNGWAWEVWMSHVLDQREDVVRTFLSLLAERVPVGADLGYLGAGPIEDFATNEDRLCWIEAEAARSDAFRAALANVYPRRALSEEQNERLRRAAATD
jgi:hypothetical protein